MLNRIASMLSKGNSLSRRHLLIPATATALFGYGGARLLGQGGAGKPRQIEAPIVDYDAKPGRAEAGIAQIPWPEPIRDSAQPVSSPHKFDEWWRELPALPFEQSDVIVLATVVHRSARLACDRRCIDSLFVVKPGIIFRPIATGYRIDEDMISTRLGGAVRFRSGRVREFKMPGEGFPKPGEDCVWFLKSHGARAPLDIITGYGNVRPAATVAPLDRLAQTGERRLPFEALVRSDFKALLEQVSDRTYNGRLP
jgi:hypothetical protein